MSETQPPRVSPARASAEVARVAVAGVTTFVGVDGPGGAGKSSLALQLAAAVPGAVVVSVDEFSGPGIAEWDWARFHEQLVAPLLAGRAARYESRSWRDAGPGEWREIDPGRLVVVEGVSATREEARVPWRLRIWVDTPADVRLARVLARDGEALRRQWVERWIPSEQAYLAAQRPAERADLVVPGDE